MLAVLFVLFTSAATTTPASHPSSQPLRGAQLQGAEDQAEAQATVGLFELQLGRLSEAQANCDAALKLDVANGDARKCLNWVAHMVVDQDLNNAQAKLLARDKSGAVALASKWVYAGGPSDRDQQNRALRIVTKAQSFSVQDLYTTITPGWLRQMLVAIANVTALILILLVSRKFWREWKRGQWYDSFPRKSKSKTNWTMLPMKELSAAGGIQTGIPTDAVLDALARLGHELESNIWQPKLLLLRPTPPANFEPAIISEFLSDTLEYLALAPGADDLSVEWKLHDVQLDQAVESLQVKTASGIDIGSVARFVRGVVEWFNAGAPTISGVAQIGSDKAVSIHLAARGGPVQSVAVTASTDSAPGIDPIQLSAERVALNFLLRMRYPGMTNSEIGGFAALRQGALQFARYAGTVPGAGEDAETRRSSLAQAAFNFGFFKASVPPHSVPRPASNQPTTSLDVTDEIRQAVLLAEGVAHSLVGGEQHLLAAIDCFHQLEDWPSSPKTELLRQQAGYNEAVVWRQMGHAGRCVLMLTALLGERAPDTVVPRKNGLTFPHDQKPELSRVIRIPMSLARLAAFATYNRDDWSTLPKSRADLLIDDAENLVRELDSICRSTETSPHDRRLANYMYTEALRAIGHVELLNIITGPAASLYHDKRPTGLKTEALNKEGSDRLQRVIDEWMLCCERVAPSCQLFCDLAEAYLLLKDFTAAQGYGRHAILECSPPDERAYYIATESLLLQNTDDSKALARKYALDFKGAVTLDEFKFVRADLGIPETSRASSA
jgi:hypothetical protein